MQKFFNKIKTFSKLKIFFQLLFLKIFLYQLKLKKRFKKIKTTIIELFLIVNNILIFLKNRLLILKN